MKTKINSRTSDSRWKNAFVIQYMTKLAETQITQVKTTVQTILSRIGFKSFNSIADFMGYKTKVSISSNKTYILEMRKSYSPYRLNRLKHAN